ncbi:MAG: undecaprenyl diphosphate synthase family protein, partial [Patescibacteria group bacterium]
MIKNIPNHVALIPDGNRRWAKEKGLPTYEGHRKGFQ